MGDRRTFVERDPTHMGSEYDRTWTAVITYPGHPEEVIPQRAKRSTSVSSSGTRVDAQLDDGVSDPKVTNLLWAAHNRLQRYPKACQAGLDRAKR